jgi:membrane AbrB-like protein
MLNIFLTVICGAAGGLTARKFRLPAAALTGSLITVIIWSLVSQRGSMPSDMKVWLQIFSGMLIGSRIKKSDLADIYRLFLPIVILFFGMMAMNLVFGGLMHIFGGLDLVTALLSSAPGGMQDMALIADDMGGNSIIVSLTQLTRVVFILAFFPTFYKKILMREPVHMCVCQDHKPSEDGAAQLPVNLKIRRFLFTALLSALGGLLFKAMQINAGALIGSMIFCGLGGICTNRTYFPVKAKIILQILAGSYIGAQVTRGSFSVLTQLIVPIFIMFVGTTLYTYFMGKLLHRLTRFDRMTCMLMCTPGGCQEMSLMADDLNCDAPKIVIIHTIRIFCVITFFPGMIEMITRLFA